MTLKSFEEMQKTSVFFILKPSNVIYVFLLSIFLFFSGLLIWAYFAQIDNIVKGNAILRPVEYISSIKCVVNGTLVEKKFINSQVVHKGDILFRFDSSVYENELETYKQELFENEADMRSNEILQIAIMTDGKFDINGYSKTDSEKARTFVLELQKYESSIANLKKELQREQAKPEILKIPYAIQDLRSKIEQSELSFKLWKANYSSQCFETKNQLILKNNTISTKIKEIEHILTNVIIESPIDGYVAEISSHNLGDYIFSGEELIQIIPLNNKELKAKIYIDPCLMTQVKIGDKVVLKFAGLPPSRYGQIITEVEIISPDVSYINEIPTYIVEAKIASPYLYTKNGKKTQLIPGLTAEARIITDKCTVLQMLLKKLDFIL